jgi:hypothetical protein
MRRSAFVLLGGTWLLACGGRVTPETTSTITFGTGSGDSSGGSDASGSPVVPTNHRASGSVCPAQRGAGSICSGEGPGDAATNVCEVDSDCTAGKNGRCFSPDGPLPACSPTSCSYDDCQSDSDCPSHVPCECRASSTDSSANLCVTGGNCAVDSDCGANGYCSPGAFTDFCGVPIYFCHTAMDTCINDSDCPPVTKTSVLQGCNYDPQLGHFACSDVCLAPP